MKKLFKNLEARCTTVAATSKLLGISASGYFQMRKGTTPVPRYIKKSVKAHLALSELEFLKLLDH